MAALERPASRRCCRFFDDDYDYLLIVARANGISRDALIRQIVSRHCKALQQREAQALALIDVLSADLAESSDLHELDLEEK